MQLRAYSIYDNKALQYHTPFFTHTDAAALRSFLDLCNDPNTTVGKHPSDYSLWFVGTYNDNNGEFFANKPLMHVADATALIRHSNILPPSEE